jgi:hypothetical protein
VRLSTPPPSLSLSVLRLTLHLNDRWTTTDDEIQDELRGSLDVQARLLYGLIHARWIVTARGLSKMVTHPFSPHISTHPHLPPSSTNTNVRISVVALASSVNNNPSSQSDSLIFPMKNLSSFIVAAAKTSTLPNHPGTARSTGHISGQLSRIFCFSLTLHCSRPRAGRQRL